MDYDLKTIAIKTTCPVKGESVFKDGKWNVISEAMPQGALCGKPVVVELEIR